MDQTRMSEEWSYDGPSTLLQEERDSSWDFSVTWAPGSVALCWPSDGRETSFEIHAAVVQISAMGYEVLFPFKDQKETDTESKISCGFFLSKISPWIFSLAWMIFYTYTVELLYSRRIFPHSEWIRVLRNVCGTRIKFLANIANWSLCFASLVGNYKLFLVTLSVEGRDRMCGWTRRRIHCDLDENLSDSRSDRFLFFMLRVNLSNSRQEGGGMGGGGWGK